MIGMDMGPTGGEQLDASWKCPFWQLLTLLCRGIRSGACAYRIGAAMSEVLQLDLADIH
jgi:hypothetical protein